MSEILILQVVVLVCGTVALLGSLRFVRRVLEIRHERSLRTPPPDLAARLDQIELTVETIAIETERIGEANRFVAKLLADRHDLAAPLAKPPERVITPH